MVKSKSMAWSWQTKWRWAHNAIEVGQESQSLRHYAQTNTSDCELNRDETITQNSLARAVSTWGHTYKAQFVCEKKAGLVKTIDSSWPQTALMMFKIRLPHAGIPYFNVQTGLLRYLVIFIGLDCKIIKIFKPPPFVLGPQTTELKCQWSLSIQKLVGPDGEEHGLFTHICRSLQMIFLFKTGAWGYSRESPVEGFLKRSG